MDEEYKVGKVKLCLMILMFLIIGSFLVVLIGYNSLVFIFIIYILVLCVVVVFYKKNIVCLIIVYIMSYFII